MQLIRTHTRETLNGGDSVSVSNQNRSDDEIEVETKLKGLAYGFVNL